MKAKQMQAQFDAQNKRTIRQHSTKRGMLAGMAAAAAVLVAGTVTVGAVNDWNYAAVFSKYFEEKSGDTVLYDFSGMGLDIGQVIEGEDCTMTIQSVLADAGSLYLITDIALSEEIQEQIAPYDDVEVIGHAFASVFSEGENGTEYFSSGGTGHNAYPIGDGVYRSMSITHMDTGTDLSDKKIEIHVTEPVYVGYNYNDDGVGTEPLVLTLPEERFVYDLADITVQEGYTVPYGGTLPNDANENVFDEMTVTPFMLRFTLRDTASRHDYAPKWGFTPEADMVAVTYTAVYADGTERQIPIAPIDSSGGHSIASRNDDGGYDTLLEQEWYFSAPLDLNGLTAIRVNDIEIPVQ